VFTPASKPGERAPQQYQATRGCWLAELGRCFSCCHQSAKESWGWQCWGFQERRKERWQTQMSSGFLLSLPVASGFLLMSSGFAGCSSPPASREFLALCGQQFAGIASA